MDTQHRLESAYVTNVPHPECRGSGTCDPTRKHKSDLGNATCDSVCNSTCDSTCNSTCAGDKPLSAAPAKLEPICQNCNKCPGTCNPCQPRVDEGVCNATCNSTCAGDKPLSAAPAMVEPICQKCHKCPGTCNPCQPSVDKGVNRNDIPIPMNVDAPVQEREIQPMVFAHRPPDRTTRTSSKPLDNDVGFKAQFVSSQPSLYGQSLEQQYKKALFYVRHAPQDVEPEFREHTGRLQREALFHQIEEGDCDKPQPWAIQVEEREKWEAWNKLHGLSKDQAMLQYLQKVSEIDPYWMNSTLAKTFTPVDEAPRDVMLL